MYQRHCSSCHGINGQGGLKVQGIPAADLTSSKIAQLSAEELDEILTRNQPPMPSFSVFPKEERALLIAYLKKLSARSEPSELASP